MTESAAAMKERVAGAVRRRIAEIDHQIRLAGYRKQTADLKAAYKNVRRAEERLSLFYKASRLKIALASSTPLSVADASAWQRLVVETSDLVLDPERVARWRQHAETWARWRGVTLCWEATPTINAYADVAGKRIESAPITTPESYADLEHEKGHHERPCRPTHTRVTIKNDRTCCVRCEIDAWKFAMHDALDWTRSMHDELRCSIATYAPFATPTEAAEIRELCSALTFRRVQLDRAMKG